MVRPIHLLRRSLLPLLGVAALALSGCSDNDRRTYTAEVDEPNYREGQAMLKNGRRQEALNAFLKVIDKRGEDSAESHLEVGLLYLQYINDPLSAIYHLKKYLALRPNSAQASLVRQRIDAATRDFARTLPAQPLENQLQRVDLVAAMDRLRQENERLKQDLADLKAGREQLVAQPGPLPERGAAASAGGTGQNGFSFTAPIPTIRTRPAATPSPVVKPATPAAKPPAPAATAGKKHIVQPGDTLSKIAQKYYNNRGRWKEILAANRGVIKSENDLKVGMELKIP